MRGLALHNSAVKYRRVQLYMLVHYAMVDGDRTLCGGLVVSTDPETAKPVGCEDCRRIYTMRRARVYAGRGKRR